MLDLTVLEQAENDKPVEAHSRGLTDPYQAHGHVQKLVDQVKENTLWSTNCKLLIEFVQFKRKIEIVTFRKYNKLEAINYRALFVSGTIYFIKVKAGKHYLHVAVFEPLPCYSKKLQLHGVQTGKRENDELDYFGSSILCTLISAWGTLKRLVVKDKSK